MKMLRQQGGDDREGTGQDREYQAADQAERPVQQAFDGGQPSADLRHGYITHTASIGIFFDRQPTERDTL